MMTVVLMLLIRHADAGSRHDWVGDDRERPLTDEGRRQAEALAGVLAEHKPVLIATSPYERCVQTVLPLARATGRPVVPFDDLGVESAATAGRTLQVLALQGTGSALVPGWTDPVVAVCTHGEVIAAALETTGAAAMAGGAEVPGPKGGTWLLRFAGDDVVGVDFLTPPG